MKTIWRQFKEGLGAKTLLAPSIGFGLFVFVLFALDIWLKKGCFISFSESHLLLREQDQFTHASYEIARLRRGKFKTPLIVLMGGSSFRECIKSEDSLKQSLESKGVSVGEVVNLSFFRQSFGETIAMIDQLALENMHLYLGINLRRFTFPPDYFRNQLMGDRLMLFSKSLNSFMELEGYKEWRNWSLLPNLFSYLNQYVNYHHRKINQFKIPETQFDPHIYKGDKILNAEEKLDKIEKVRKFYSRLFPEHYAFNLRALQFVINLARSKNIPVTLVELPLNPILTKEFQAMTKVYQEEVTQLASTYHLPYWKFVEDLNLSVPYFNDHAHLMGEGRKVFEAALVNEIRKSRSLKVL